MGINEAQGIQFLLESLSAVNLALGGQSTGIHEDDSRLPWG
jgi:hypothetical protein